MIEIFKTATVADFNRRYSQTYGWCEINGKRQLVYIDSVGSHYVAVIDSSGAYHEFAADTGFKFEFTPTQRGWYNKKQPNTKPRTVLVTRVPARQWQRGICSANTMFSEWHVGDRMMRHSRLSMEAMHGIDWEQWKFFDVFPFAMSRQFAIMASGEVMFYNRHAGIYDVNKKEASIHPLIFQEFYDCVQRNQLPFKVKQHEASNDFAPLRADPGGINEAVPQRRFAPVPRPIAAVRNRAGNRERAELRPPAAVFMDGRPLPTE